MKSIIAERVSDGWAVKITDTHHLSCEEDVRNFIAQEGLEVAKEFSHSYRIVTKYKRSGNEDA